jgi:hypothetical protein
MTWSDSARRQRRQLGRGQVAALLEQCLQEADREQRVPLGLLEQPVAKRWWDRRTSKQPFRQLSDLPGPEAFHF